MVWIESYAICKIVSNGGKISKNQAWIKKHISENQTYTR